MKVDYKITYELDFTEGSYDGEWYYNRFLTVLKGQECKIRQADKKIRIIISNRANWFKAYAYVLREICDIIDIDESLNYAPLDYNIQSCSLDITPAEEEILKNVCELP
jgi:predicted nucleotidyltransferase